jgi:hypothetical protein
VPFPAACSSFSDFKNREMEDKLMDNHDTEYTLLVGKKRILVT